MGTFEVDFENRRPQAPHRDGGSVKYRLDVVASSPADVVGSVGGWLYDRVRAGWDVYVLLPQRCDSRPLQILGIQVADLDWQILSASTEYAARGLAVSADMFASDARIRQEVLTALDRWMTEVTLWHDDWPLDRRAPDRHGAACAQRCRARVQASRARRGRYPGQGRPDRDTALRHESVLAGRFRADPGWLMRKYYGHTLLYLHETIALGSGSSDRFIEEFTGIYQPMMHDLGARLFALWETAPYNGHWPQVTIIWEIDAFADYARIGSAQARGGSHESAAKKWSAFLAAIGASGEGRIMYPGPSNKTLAQLREANFSASVVIQEIMQTKPGRQDDYIRELERLYVPWSERTGKHWLGSFTTTFRFNEVIHYWALEGGWDCFAEHYPSWKDSPPAEIVTWMSVAPALRDGWEDSILQALPPSPLQ